MTGFSREKSEREQAERRLHFARFCWVNRDKMTPKSRMTWEERFNQMEGVSLRDYIKEYKSTHNQKERR